MFLNEKDLYKAKAKYWENQFKYLIDQHWVQSEAEFRFELDGSIDDNDWLESITSAIDERLDT